jgi:hypothetical protein
MTSTGGGSAVAISSGDKVDTGARKPASLTLARPVDQCASLQPASQ